MYPAQTSLIPATAALLRFFNENGFSAFSQNYPFWYAGSTPFKFLIGPVLPLLTVFLKKIFPAASNFDVILILLALAIIAGGAGLIILVRKITKTPEDRGASFGFIYLFCLYLLFPYKYLSALALDDATYSFAKYMIPFVLVLFWNYLMRRNPLNFVLAGTGVALILLVSTKILIVIIIGFAGLCLTASYKNNKFRHMGRKFKRAFYVIFTGFLAATFWYGPQFWLVQLINPGIGGDAGAVVLAKAGEFLRNTLPVFLALGSVFIFKKFSSRLSIFAVAWLSAFVILSLFRFLGNPNFWMDWITFTGEIETGLFLAALALYRASKMKPTVIPLLTSVLIFVALYVRLDKPRLLSFYPPESVGSLALLKTVPRDSIVYLTGANVFWLNAFLDVTQVRGGRDEVSRLNGWQKDSYTIREGENGEAVLGAVKNQSIRYVFLNTRESFDFYKDYKNIDLWKTLGSVESVKNGDMFIKIP